MRFSVYPTPIYINIHFIDFSFFFFFLSFFLSLQLCSLVGKLYEQQVVYIYTYTHRIYLYVFHFLLFLSYLLHLSRIYDYLLLLYTK